MIDPFRKIYFSDRTGHLEYLKIDILEVKKHIVYQFDSNGSLYLIAHACRNHVGEIIPVHCRTTWKLKSQKVQKLYRFLKDSIIILKK